MRCSVGRDKSFEVSGCLEEWSNGVNFRRLKSCILDHTTKERAAVASESQRSEQAPDVHSCPKLLPQAHDYLEHLALHCSFTLSLYNPPFMLLTIQNAIFMNE